MSKETFFGGNQRISDNTGLTFKTGGTGRHINLESSTGDIIVQTTDAGLVLPKAPLAAAYGGTGFTNPGPTGNLIQSNGAGQLIAHGGPLGTGAIAIGGGDGYWDSSPLPANGNQQVLVWTGSALVWGPYGNNPSPPSSVTTATGTYIPTVLANCQFTDAAQTNPNYASGGISPQYGTPQSGNWSSTQETVNGITLYRVQVNAYIVITDWAGSVPQLNSFTVSLPFANQFDNYYGVLIVQNGGGQLTVPIYAMSGQQYIAGFNFNTWVPSHNDWWKFSFTYYTPTNPNNPPPPVVHNRGTYLPVIYGNAPVFEQGAVGRYPNYIGNADLTNPTYGYQYGNWVSLPVTVDGILLYKVKVNVSVNITAWNGFFSNLDNIIITLPFPNHYDNEFGQVSWSNSGGQIQPFFYSNSGQSNVVATNNGEWDPGSTVYTFTLIYFTSTVPT